MDATQEELVFFGIAVGFTMPWIALSSELGYLKMLHGPDVLLYLNLAYFAPSLPILILQLLFDHGYNRLYGTALATLFRQAAALLVSAVCCTVLPFLSWSNLHALLAVTGVIGSAASVALGSSSQLVALFPPPCGQALSLGIVSAGPVVLLLQCLQRIGAHPSPMHQMTFFQLCALFPLVALAGVVALLCRHWHTLQAGDANQEGDTISEAPSLMAGSATSAEAVLPLVSIRSQDSAHSSGALGHSPVGPASGRPSLSLLERLESESGAWDAWQSQGLAVTQPLLLPAPPRRSTQSVHGPLSPPRTAPAHSTIWAAAAAVAPLAMSLGSSISVCVMLFPLFTMVRSSGWLGPMLPQALFAARMLADISGRLLARRMMPSLAVLKAVAIIKALSLPAAIAYLWAPQGSLSDAGAVVFVAWHWLLSGLIAAWAFMRVPSALPSPELAAQGGAVMSGAFQVATVLGLAAVTLLEHFTSPPTGGVRVEPPIVIDVGIGP